MNSKADFEGCTLKTMNALKKYAAPEKAKSEKEPERACINYMWAENFTNSTHFSILFVEKVEKVEIPLGFP